MVGSIDRPIDDYPIDAIHLYIATCRWRTLPLWPWAAPPKQRRTLGHTLGCPTATQLPPRP